LELWQSYSTNELLASIEKYPTEKRARFSPFLDFLGGGGSKQSVSHEDSVTLQNWVIQTIARQMRFVKNPLHHKPARHSLDRRDLRRAC
jgi:hypothetical protein